ncbi:MAG: ThiF family adenylyltransferase [Candidatus Thermoplasmatota archaeon]|nr:ThiF family adenylyltransferase [Candidatus Thermoplasmatota archaeon]
MTNILIIGAGGIGGLLVDLIARAISESGFNEHFGKVTLTIMDGDSVESRNLPHQRFSRNDIGRPKVVALIDSIGISDGIDLIPICSDFSSETDISPYDLVIVAVDREEPRDHVHEFAEHWLDLRSTGDGVVMFSHDTDENILQNHPRLSENESASCQLNGAIEKGNIQFGFALAATFGAQWTIQWLRGRPTPSSRMYSIHMGLLPFFVSPEVDV